MSNTAKSIVVTGASTGIGRAIAAKLHDQGFQVFAGVRNDRDATSLSEVSSGRITPLLLDVTEPESIKRSVSEVDASLGEMGLRGLVNNAGIVVPGPLEFLPDQEARRQFDVNVFGVLRVTQAFLPLLRRGQGRIVNIGSVNGRLAFPFIGAYCASKFALRGLTDALRLELSFSGIRVSLIEPGAVATSAVQKVLANGQHVSEMLHENGGQVYERPFQRFLSQVKNLVSMGAPPELTAEVVLTALTTASPQLTYPAGPDAETWMKLTNAPDFERDALILQQFGLS